MTSPGSKPTTPTPLHRGMRVMTPRGVGTVAYVRMAPPDYATAEAVSVVLDERLDRPGYAGTMFRADLIASGS